LRISPAHAALTGEVCLADPTTAAGSTTPCPATPPVFDGVRKQQIRIGVFIQGSEALNGFDIVLLTSHSTLVPTGADLTGTVLSGTPTVILECLQGVLRSGSTCSVNDTVDTLHFTVAGGLGLLTTPPTTGLLFTAIYNVTGTTVSTGIPVGYRTLGCTGTSVSGLCVTISNGSTTPPSETAQGGTFNNSTPPPFVSLSATPSSFGPEFPSTPNTATITATASPGYPGFATDSVAFTAASTQGLTATFSGTNPCVTGGASCSVSLSLTAAAIGNYSATVFGTYATLDSSNNPDTLVANVTLVVIVYDYGFTVNPTSISFSSGLTGTATVTLTSLNHFAGSIALSTGTIIPATPPLTITYNPIAVTLTAGGVSSSIATFGASPTGSTTYHAQIKATSGTRVKTSSTLTVTVSPAQPDFAVAANPTSVPPMAVGVAGTSTITVTDVGGFTSPVSLGSVSSSSSLTCSVSPTSLTGSGTATLSCTGSAGGSFTATVTGTSGTLSHSVTVGFIISQGSDFNVSASPTTVTVNAGASGTSTITVTALRGFTGTVTLTATASSGLSATLSPTSITTSGTSTLTFSAAVAGTYTVTVTGSNSTTFSHSSSPIHVNVIDFGLVASPTSLTIPQGSNKTSSVSLTSQNGFAGSVSLTVVSSAGLTATIKPVSISGTMAAVLNVTASNTIAPGSYNVNVTGDSGSLTHTIEVLVTVPPNDFTLSASPSTVSVAVSTNGMSTINLSSLVSFAGTVTLTLQLPTSVTGSLSSSTVTLVKGGTGSSVLTVNAAVAGSFLVNVTGASGSLSHTIIITVVAAVPNFTLQSSSTSVSVVAGVQGTALLTLAPVNSFTGTVALASSISPAIGLTCSFTPASIVLGASQTSTLSCGGSAGTYTITVTGTSGSLSHQLTVMYTVTDFGLSASPTSVKTVTGAAVTSTITVAPVNGFAGAIALTAVELPAGLTCSLSPTSVMLGVSQTSTLSCSSTTANNYLVTVTGAFGGLTHAATVEFNVTDFAVTASPSSVTVNRGQLGSSTITVASVNGFSGTIALTASAAPAGLTCTLTPSSVFLGTSLTSQLSCSSATSGSFTVLVTAASGSLTHTVTLNYAIADIQVSTPTPTITVAENATGFVSVTISSVSGFSGSASLTLSVTTNVPPSAQPHFSLNQNTVTLTAGSSSPVLLNITVGPRAAPGTYAIVVTATIGTLIDFTTIVLTVPRTDFSLTVNPPADSLPIILTPGAAGTNGLTVAGLYGFNGSVTFSLTVAPATGLSCSLSQTSAGLVPGHGIGSTVLSCHGSVGSYDVAISGAATELYSTGTVHTAHVGYVVVDFTVQTTPSGILVNNDQQGHAQINVTWARGYAGVVDLKVVSSSGLLSASISPSSLSGSGLATLTVSSSTSGTYSVVVNATSGGTFHTATVTVTVSSVSNVSTIFGVDQTIFYSFIGVLAVAIVAGLVAVSRRGKRPKK
jgi:hypothetical protein